MPLSRKAYFRQEEGRNGRVLYCKWYNENEMGMIVQNLMTSREIPRQQTPAEGNTLSCSAQLSCQLHCQDVVGVQKCSWVQVYKRDPSIAVQHFDPDAISGFENVYTASYNK